MISSESVRIQVPQLQHSRNNSFDSAGMGSMLDEAPPALQETKQVTDADVC